MTTASADSGVSTLLFENRVQYRPCPQTILDRYSSSGSEVLYSERLSASTVSLVSNSSNPGMKIVKKHIAKSKLFSSSQVHQARKECAIQDLFCGHENIVQLLGYTETERSFDILMEYCNSASYLEHEILERKKEIRDETQLRDYATQILTAIDHIHSQGVVHADLKL